MDSIRSRGRDVLRAIADLRDELGYSPSYEEVAERVWGNRGMKGGAHEHVARLRLAGLVTVTPQVARSVALTDAGRELLAEAAA